MTTSTVYSRNEKLWVGMNLDEARNSVNNTTFRNDKAKDKAMEKAIIRFGGDSLFPYWGYYGIIKKLQIKGGF